MIDINAPIYLDWLLAICLAIAAGTQYIWLAFHGSTFGRWLQAIGFTGLAMRIAWSLAQGGDPPIAAVSIPLLVFIAAGSAVTAVQQMRMLWMDVRCLQKPEHRCYREDRVKMALLERFNK